MIRPIDINLNAAHPELPLVEATTFTGAPSSVFIRGVPKAVGNWSITAVSVAVTYPDNTTTARAAVESAEGVWVATIPGTATSGRTVAGFRILADGIDENGAAVTGYVLGFADFAVLSFFPVPAPGETFFYLRYFDAMPTAAKKMDVTTIDGVLKFYNGTAWEAFDERAYGLAATAFNRAAQAITATNQINIALATDYYTSAQTDEAIDKLAAYYITADAQGNPFATHAALVYAQTYYSGGAVRTPTRNDYAVVSADETHGGAEWRYIYAVDAQGAGQWEPQYAVEGVIAYDNTVTPTSANGVKSSGIWSALWGALSALPTGFSSLYDWCVSQLAGKLSTSGGTMDSSAEITWSNSFPGSPTYSISRGGIKSRSALPSSNWTKLWSEIAEISKTVPTSRTVNGKALTDDVTLTGADIPVDATQGAQKINAALNGKASTADATLNLRGPNHDGLSTWNVQPVYPAGYTGYTGPNWDDSHLLWVITFTGHPIDPDVSMAAESGNTRSSLSITFADGTTATRTALPGYQLGSQSDKPLASEAEAEALRDGKLDKSGAIWNVSYTEDGLRIFDDAGVYYIEINPGAIRTNYPDGLHNVYWPINEGTTALLENLAGNFSSSTAYAKDALVVYTSALYRCTNPNGHTGAWVAADFTVATVEDVLAALRTGKANAGDLPYAISESIPLTVTSGAASTTLGDRTHNVRTIAAPGSGNTTTITATLPEIVAGKSRDMFLNLTVGTQASDAGDISLSIVEPSGATVQIDIGSVEDIGVGENEIMIFERALPTTSGNVTTTHWLVTVRHEDFAS